LQRDARAAFIGALQGAAAGAAGTTALNAVTYLDMAIRGRPSSSTPEQTVERLSEKAGIRVPGDGEERKNRLAGLGPLMGLVAGVGTGALIGCSSAVNSRAGATALGATVVAMVAGNGPMTVLGVTDPRTWSAPDWVADVVPHLAYGLVVSFVLQRFARP
jgi:drug/metabolite transporter (DMT)-like permease